MMRSYCTHNLMTIWYTSSSTPLPSCNHSSLQTLLRAVDAHPVLRTARRYIHLTTPLMHIGVAITITSIMRYDSWNDGILE